MELPSGKVKTLNEFNPQTFAERGVVVGFTKPELFLSRVRHTGKDGAELVVRNISGGKGFYIVGWRGLPEVMPLTMHDAMLYQEICEQGAFDPVSIRKAGLAVARSGYAGSAAANSAEALEAKDRDQILLTQFGLIAALLSASGVEKVSLMSVAMSTPQQQERLKGALKNVAPVIGVDPARIFQVVEGIAEALYPVGMPGSPAPGRLRRTLDALRDLQATMNGLAAEEAPEYRPLAAYLADSAGVNIVIMHEVLKTVDDLLADVLVFVKSWIAHEETVRSLLARGAWLLDGWDYLIGLWRSAAEEEIHARRQVLEEAASLAPVVPHEGFKWAGAEVKGPAHMVFSNRRWFKANEDWRSAVTAVERQVRNEELLARRT